MDRGAWRATVHGVAQSQTRLKRLSTAQSNQKGTKLFREARADPSVELCLSLRLDKLLKNTPFLLPKFNSFPSSKLPFFSHIYSSKHNVCYIPN